MLGYSDVSLNITSKVYDFFRNYLKTEILINIKYKRIYISIISYLYNYFWIVKVCL